MLKKQIRKEFVVKRHAITQPQQAEMDERILEHFRSLSLQGIMYLMTYYALKDRREFDPANCEQLLKLENKSLLVCLPKLANDGLSMEAVLREEGTALVSNRYNIPEPEWGNQVDPQLIDAVFVPLLAFDQKGLRVGYGKGFYDRFLARCSNTVVKIGFSYFEAVEQIDDVDEYDVPLNFCITPERIYEF